MQLEPTLLISQVEIAKHIDVAEVLKGVEEVYLAHGKNQVVMPAKITLDMRSMGLESWHNAMPAYVGPMEAAGIKWAGGYSRNPQDHGLPYVMATIILQDPATGYPLAIMDGAHITNLRTGAAAAVCAKYYARKDSQVVAFVGAGVQARSALSSLVKLFQLEEVRVYDIRPEAAAAYADQMSAEYGLAVKACASVEEAVSPADIVITVTFANAPLVKGAWLKPGSTALSMGSYQEFDDAAVLKADKIVVDSWDQCAHRGELKRFAETGRMTREHIFAEVAESVAGTRPARENDQERILVVPIGLGSHDIAVAKIVYDRVKNTGGGSPFRFI